MEEEKKVLEDFKEVLSLTKRYLKQEKERGLREVAISYKPQAASHRLQKETLEKLRKEVEGCKKCPLWRERNNVVFGEGNPNARLILIGEAPGRNEDLQGKPFVGAAGKLLTKILASIGLKREDVFIGNILKCRPPMNRNPRPEEIKACWGYLDKQLKIIKPRIILAMGTFAAQTLLKTDERISRIRGEFHPFAKGVKFLATYHPAALLRNPGYKKSVWADMKLLKKEYQRL
jgi:uracil-DNA glycosylase family 4